MNLWALGISVANSAKATKTVKIAHRWVPGGDVVREFFFVVGNFQDKLDAENGS